MSTNKNMPTGIGVPDVGTNAKFQLQDSTIRHSSQISSECRKAAYEQRPVRYQKILDFIGDKELTARDVCYGLGYSEPNAVRPRMTELKDAGILIVIGKRKDDVTGVKVSVYKVNKRATAPCRGCGNEMQWTGKIWICCEHCGALQCWPVKEGKAV